MTITESAPEPDVPVRYDALQIRTKLAEALRLTQEYLGDDVLPRIEGWEWYDATRAYETYMAERAESGLISHARSELERAGLFDEDSDYGGHLARHIMDLVEVFSAGGHSGGSAMMTIEIFGRLARYEPLPLSMWMGGGVGVRSCPPARRAVSRGVAARHRAKLRRTPAPNTDHRLRATTVRCGLRSVHPFGPSQGPRVR